MTCEEKYVLDGEGPKVALFGPGSKEKYCPQSEPERLPGDRVSRH